MLRPSVLSREDFSQQGHLGKDQTGKEQALRTAVECPGRGAKRRGLECAHAVQELGTVGARRV